MTANRPALLLRLLPFALLAAALCLQTFRKIDCFICPYVAVEPGVSSARSNILPVANEEAAKPADEQEGAEETEPLVLIDPAEGEISQHTTITLNFPEPMVAEDQLYKPGLPWPVVFEPEIKADFDWRSATEGLIVLNQPLLPAQKYTVKLAPGLKDAAGKLVEDPKFSPTFTTPDFIVTSEVSPSSHLRARPSIAVDFNYPVVFEQLAKHAWFQDRDSRERVAADVIVRTDSDEVQLRGREVRLAPQKDLLLGRTYDLIIDGVPEAESNRPLDRIYVFPLGTTVSMKTQWVGAFNHIQQEPMIVAKFSDIIDPETVTPQTVTVEPAIPNQEVVANGDEIVITGDIEPRTVYRVTISTEVKGVRGFGLAEPSKWRATARVKSPGIVFPNSELIERSRLGLRFAFVQANTPEITWRLARIPLEQLPYVRSRLNEWSRTKTDPLRGVPVIDPKTGFEAAESTELLIDSLRLQVAGSGTVPAAGEEEEVERKIDWAPADGASLSGPYLMEASTKLPDGRVIGNRTIVSFSDLILTIKQTGTRFIFRATRMTDGEPVANIPIQAIASNGVSLLKAVTDSNGVAWMEKLSDYGANGSPSYYVATTPEGPALQFASLERAAGYTSSSYAPGNKFLGEIVTDRNLYRPGHTVKFKGFARTTDSAGNLNVPAGGLITWKIMKGYSDEVATGTALVSPDGGWEGEWTVPAANSIGNYQVRDSLKGFPVDSYGGTSFQVEEFRTPLFTVSVTQEPQLAEEGQAVQSETATFVVQSNYFHGAPNAQASVAWSATWINNEPYINSFRTDDAYSQNAKTLQDSVTVTGTAELDKDGRALVEIPNAFKDGMARGRVSVSFEADVTSVDGQTIKNGAYQTLQFPKQLLGIQVSEQVEQQSGVNVQVEAFDENDASVAGISAEVETFQINTKTVKEQVAPAVFQYRNSSEYVSVDKRAVQTPANFTVPAQGTGRFVSVARVPNNPSVPAASEETYVTGTQPAEVPVEDDIKFTLEKDKDTYNVGERAILWLQAPFAGKAWITVETNEVIDSFYHTMKGNSDRFELPVKKEYAPNCTVTVYVVRPGGDNALPLERIATTSVRVNRPDLMLEIAPVTTKPSVRPGELVDGKVLVTADGKPVQNTELLVFAVDDAILELGSWRAPNLMNEFYPYRPWLVETYFALKRYVTAVSSLSLYQKGFVLGDKGNFDEQSVRKDFKPLAFWNANLKTDSSGAATFSFHAPDSLTRYRVVAIGQTRRNQFGVGETSVEVSKPLMAEPALPRFLRQQDEVELRVVLRQNYADADDIILRCTAGSGLELTSGERETVSTKKDLPAVARFRAKVADTATAVKVRFDATSKAKPQERDSVEITIPVFEPEVMRQESVAGNLPAKAPLQLASTMPQPWQSGLGSMNITVSTSRFLPALQGIPRILDYPHGCMEQISTRMLAYGAMGNLLAYVPEVSLKDNNYRKAIESGLALYEQAITSEGYLPYWHGSAQPNYFVTVLAAWAVKAAEKAGFTVPETVKNSFPVALEALATGSLADIDSTTRAFALMVLGEYQVQDEEAIVEAAKKLYLTRDKMAVEGRSMLALAFQRLGILPEEKRLLLREIGAEKPVADAAFNPKTFSSPDRAEAIRWLALIEAGGDEFAARKQEIRDGLLKLMQKSSALSTQENLWLLMAFQATVGAEKSRPVDDVAVAGRRGEISRNGSSALWSDVDLANWRSFALKTTNEALTYVISAEYRTGSLLTERRDNGFRVERVVQNLTDAGRTGATDKPFKLGDQLLITYRVYTKNAQYYVALEDLLPAGLETVNWNLFQVAKFYNVPAQPDATQLELSNAELADQAVRLYFDAVAPGLGTYSVLARATAEGKFTWPATQVSPMYDARFSGLSASAVCAIGK